MAPPPAPGTVASWIDLHGGDDEEAAGGGAYRAARAAANERAAPSLYPDARPERLPKHTVRARARLNLGPAGSEPLPALSAHRGYRRGPVATYAFGNVVARTSAVSVHAPPLPAASVLAASAGSAVAPPSPSEPATARTWVSRGGTVWSDEQLLPPVRASTASSTRILRAVAEESSSKDAMQDLMEEIAERDGWGQAPPTLSPRAPTDVDVAAAPNPGSVPQTAYSTANPGSVPPTAYTGTSGASLSEVAFAAPHGTVRSSRKALLSLWDDVVFPNLGPAALEAVGKLEEGVSAALAAGDEDGARRVIRYCFHEMYRRMPVFRRDVLRRFEELEGAAAALTKVAKQARTAEMAAEGYKTRVQELERRYAAGKASDSGFWGGGAGAEWAKAAVAGLLDKQAAKPRRNSVIAASASPLGMSPRDPIEHAYELDAVGLTAMATECHATASALRAADSALENARRLVLTFENLLMVKPGDVAADEQDLTKARKDVDDAQRRVLRLQALCENHGNSLRSAFVASQNEGPDNRVELSGGLSWEDIRDAVRMANANARREEVFAEALLRNVTRLLDRVGGDFAEHGLKPRAQNPMPEPGPEPEPEVEPKPEPKPEVKPEAEAEPAPKPPAEMVAEMRRLRWELEDVRRELKEEKDYAKSMSSTMLQMTSPAAAASQIHFEEIHDTLQEFLKTSGNVSPRVKNALTLARLSATLTCFGFEIEGINEGLLDKQTENLKSPEKMKAVAATSNMSALEDEATPSEPVGAERA